MPTLATFDGGSGDVISSGSAFLLEQTAIFCGVLDLVEGTDRTPIPPRVTAAALDALLGCLTVLVLALGARGGLASPRWATTHARSRVHIVMGLDDTVHNPAVRPRDVERPERDHPPSRTGIGRIVAGSMAA